MKQLERTVEWAHGPEVAERAIARKWSFIERLHDHVSRANPVSFSAIGGYHGAIARLHWLLGDVAQAVHQHQIGVWYAHWWRRLQTMDEGDHVRLPLIGTDQLVQMDARPQRVQVTESDLTRGLMVGDMSYLQLLLGWDQPRPEPDEQTWKTEHRRLWLSFFADRADLDERLVALQRELDSAPNGSRSSSGQIWKDPYWAEWRLMRAIANRSQVDFDAAILAAHDYHVAHYLSEDPDTGGLRSGHEGVVMNRPFSVIVSHGVGSGLELNHSSPYFVDWVPLARGLSPVAPGYEP